MKKAGSGNLLVFGNENNVRTARAWHIDVTGRTLHGIRHQIGGLEAVQCGEGFQRVFAILIALRDGALRRPIGEIRNISVQRLFSAGPVQSPEKSFQGPTLINQSRLKFMYEAVVLRSGTARKGGNHQIRLQGANMKSRLIGAIITVCSQGGPGTKPGNRDCNCESEGFSPHSGFP